jgi:murein DD-endopeptidase MepM/ murein hydrolase activator NlpD
MLVLAAPAGAASPGGTPSTPPPVLQQVKCKRDCEDGIAQTGSVLAVSGTNLSDVVSVTFAGSPLAGDETSATAKAVKPDSLRVKVPRHAESGSIVLVDSTGRESGRSAAVTIERVASPKRTSGPIASVVTGHRVFVDGSQRPTLAYRLQTGAPADVTVTVVRLSNGRVVKTFDEGTVRPGSEERVSWSGSRQGRYAFVVSALGRDGARATTAGSPEADAFVLLGHKFPIRAHHEYGQGFGAGRGHEGADVFAACGSPLVAARGGTVKINKFQSRAGNYVVIDGAQTGIDYMYAHLRDPALVGSGDRVHTGDPIGFVGDTGDASGCHLHMELWDAPGWYTGGSPFDPVPSLRAWDRLS